MNVISLVLAAALSAGNAEFDESAVKGAWEISVSRVRTQLAGEGLGDGELAALMLADPLAYANAEEAERLAERAFLDGTAARFTNECAKIAARLSLAVTNRPAFGEEAKAALVKRFAERYPKERAEACQRQAKTIATKVKPAESEIGVRDEKTLREELRRRIVEEQKTAVFQENLAYIETSVVEPILAAAKKEFARQKEYLMRTRTEAYAPSALERELEGNLRRNVAERRKRNSDPMSDWDVFPQVVKECVKPIAEKRTLERVARCVDEVKVPVDAGRIRRDIASDRAAHRQASESERIFRTAFAAEISSGALALAVAAAPEAEREEFSKYVKDHAASPAIDRAVETRVKRELLPEVKKVRAVIAEEDAEKRWPTLMDGTWFPEPELADAMCARSDYAKAVKNWRQSPGLVALAGASAETMLEESDRLADGKVAAAFERARSAITAQNAILGELAPQVLGEAKARKASWFRRTPDVKSITEMLVTGVGEKWGAARETVLWSPDEEKPANADRQHAEIFPSVRRRIDEMAKTIFEEMEKKDPQPEVKTEAKPEIPPEEPPEEKPEEPSDSDSEPTAEEPAIVISVKQSADGIELGLRNSGKQIFKRRAGMNLKDFRGAMKELTDALGSEVLKLK